MLNRHVTTVSAWIAPLLLIAVAISQIALSQVADLTPWKGGGFGMFASLDTMTFRRLEIVVEAPERSETIAIAPSLDEAARRAAAFPSDRMLERLADAVAARERRNERPVDRVRIVVWRREFDRVTLHARERQLRAFTTAVR